MASESLTPPPDSGGGYAKYLVVLLLVLGGGLGVFFATRKEPQPKPAAAPIKNAERPTAFSQPTIELPEEEPTPEDAAVPLPDKKPVRTGGNDPWSCSGEIPAAELRRVVADNQSAIRSCYERQLRNDNQLQGDVKLQVRVGNDGRVAATRTGGNLRDNEVKNCIQNIAKSWTFPAPSQGSCAVFDAPFKFTPKQ